jgi:uncharacterized protein (DUF305 family)
MSLSRRSVVLSAAAVAAAPPASAQTHAGDAGHPSAVHPGSFATEMHARMRAMAETMNRVSMTGDPDRDFLAMMIPHHQGAIDMARPVLVHGRDPLTRQLAEEIMASQQAEIGSMQGRLATLERAPPGGAEAFPALTGTRGGASP